jgi:hypothetical protein
MEEDFYASIKLKTGEEIFAKVVPCEEKSKFLLLVTNPIVIKNFEDKRGRSGYKIESWMKTTREDMFVINMDDVITISETKDTEMIFLYHSYLEKFNFKKLNGTNKPNILTRDMGYISNINDAKEMLEKIYKNL